MRQMTALLMAMIMVNAGLWQETRTCAGEEYSVERVLTDADLVPPAALPAPDPDPAEAVPLFAPDKPEETAGVNGRYALPLGTIGEVEMVYLEELPLPFAARIDTGAATCSLDTIDLKNFERDGKPWVAFKLVHRESGQEREFEKKVKRVVSIKSEEGKRPVVEMTIRMGELVLQRDFTLNDRSDFEYQVLIGRNLLNGLAAVDVSQAQTLTTPPPASAE